MRRSGGRDPAAPHALVIGFGNPLAGDDAAGPEAAVRLDGRAGVVVKIVHQLTPDLAADVAAANRVIFVDAASGGRVVCSAPIAPVENAPAFTHALGPQAVLSLARDVYGRIPPAFLVTLPGRQFSLGSSLSPQTRRAIPAALRAVRRLLRESSPGLPAGP